MVKSKALSGMVRPVLTGSLAAFLSGAAAMAGAQDFPTRPLRLVSIFAAGSATDVNARFAAQKLSEQLGQSVVVENNGGAGGLLAMRSVARTQPPGYTLLYTTNGLVGNLYVYKDPGYKLEDYTIVGPVGLSAYGMMVHASVPAKNLAEFIAYAKANPGKLNFGSVGPTAGSSILPERLMFTAGIHMVNVPFKGGDPAGVALLAGDIQVYFATFGTTRNRIRTGKVRGLAVSSEQRSPLLPDLPTFKEQGYSTMSLGVWNAIFVPSGAPRPAIQKLQDAMARASATAEMKTQLERMEFEPWSGTLDQFTAYIRAEGVAIGEDIRRLKIPMQD